MAHFRKSADATLKGLADMEAAAEKDLTDRLRLADGWWDWAAKQPGPVGEAAKARAADHYREAESDASGVTLAKLQQRLGESAPRARPSIC